MSVVIGFIPDEYGEAALVAGFDEARRRATGVVVVNNTRSAGHVDRRTLGADSTVGLEQRLLESGLPHELRHTVGLDIADEILAIAEEVAADAIVIGVRRRTPVGKLIMGSVAQRVIIDAECPVIAVKPD